jgi:exonuclease VII large subunit
MSYTIKQTLTDRVNGYFDRVKSLVESYSFNRPKDYLREFVQTLDEFDRSLQLKFHHFVELTFQKHLNFSQRLESTNPRGVLKRGYTMVRHKGTIVTSSKKLDVGERAVIEFHDGEVPTKVER